MTRIRRSAFRNVWNSARIGLARLNRALADAGDPPDMVFHVREPTDFRPSEDRGRARQADGGRDQDPKRDFQ
jgi:hypothetical protein